MILIVSINNDTSTLNTLHWLSYFEQPFLRLNETDLLQLKTIGIQNHQPFDNNILLTTFGAIDLSTVKSYWYRRGFLNMGYYSTENSAVDKYLKEDNNDIEEYIYAHLDNQNSINRLSDTNINKLICLKKAAVLDIAIPNTIVTTKKTDLSDFYFSNSKKIITKGLYNGYAFEIGGVGYSLNTSLFEYEQLQDKITDTFFPTLFQAYTEKKFELRTFYLKGKFYASAIFSQNDEQTKIDFRNYNTVKPNRVTPFKLPLLLETKLKKLMDAMNLNSGSIDMIYTPNGQYVFLEVNPVGQFAQVSDPCNYYLPKEIAKCLIN